MQLLLLFAPKYIQIFVRKCIGMKNRITSLFGITYPIIQAGMIWTSGWRLASAVSRAGGLGIIGAGSMYPEVLDIHLKKYKQATALPFAVNVPLLYPNIEKIMAIIIQHKVPIVFTSAGNPALWTEKLKAVGIKVVHVVSSVKFAVKCEKIGVDAVVAEGFEAGGHNGRDETTTLCLIPMIRDAVQIPLIAAGGIGDGRSMLAAFALGAEAVQVGSRFVASEEASCHINFKNKVLEAKEGDTMLTLKKLTPVRLIKNQFFHQIAKAESEGVDNQALVSLLGRARAKKGMFEGDMDEGELEIGQVSAAIHEILPAGEIVKRMWDEFLEAKNEICNL